ncbi:MAG TPA: ABC transporter ATP-binding protein [Nitrososphaerales archaeon]|nr:ABC transporter ATP-binding protein [Nitrososphaerales archaeon]
MYTGTSTPLLRVSNLNVEYSVRNHHSITAVDNLSLEIPSSGYTLGLVGESGSGKSSLGMGIMNSIEPPGRISSGSVEYNGQEILKIPPEKLRAYRWEEVSMIYQSAMNSLNPVKTAADHIVEVLVQHRKTPKPEARKEALKLLSQVGIKPERANNFQHQLSGGMRQRVVIAMALALSPKLLIADEPTSALDVVVQRQILSLLKKNVRERNLSLLFITHEIAILRGLVDHIAVMYKGAIVERGPLQKVLDEPLHPYTEMLLDSLLTIDEDPKNNVATSTEKSASVRDSPRIEAGTNYCKYVGLCKYAFERCKVEKPVLQKIGQGDRLVACHKYA